jgi:hypothetical protein
MMRIFPGVLLLQIGLMACAARSEENQEESTRVATDTLVERREVVDTLLVRTDSTVAQDTSITADTTIVADTAVTADTTVASDTTRIGDQGVIQVDTVPADSVRQQ